MQRAVKNIRDDHNKLSSDSKVFQWHVCAQGRNPFTGFSRCNPKETKINYCSFLASKPIVFFTCAEVISFQKRKKKYLLIHMNPGAGAFQKVPRLTALNNSKARGGSSYNMSRGPAP